jgi:hypothetical protein
VPHAAQQISIEIGDDTGGFSPARDREIVHWIGRMGAVTIGQVRQRFGLGRTVAYRRVAACADGELLERIDVLRGQPALIRTTRRGLRLVGLQLTVAQVPPELVAHWVVCGWVALAVEGEFGPSALRSEREIRMEERWASRPIASAKIGEGPDGSDRLHLPDLAALHHGAVVAVEVELTQKAPRRLESIIKAWRRARWISEVRYYVPAGGVAAAVERAVVRTHAAERVRIIPLESVLGSTAG